MGKLLNKIARKLGYRPPQSFTVSAVVHRADGTVEDLGVIGRGTATFAPGVSGGTVVEVAPPSKEE